MRKYKSKTIWIPSDLKYMWEDYCRHGNCKIETNGCIITMKKKVNFNLLNLFRKDRAVFY